jgi:hypothetical protein
MVEAPDRMRLACHNTVILMIEDTYRLCLVYQNTIHVLTRLYYCLSETKMSEAPDRMCLACHNTVTQMAKAPDRSGLACHNTVTQMVARQVLSGM